MIWVKNSISHEPPTTCYSLCLSEGNSEMVYSTTVPSSNGANSNQVYSFTHTPAANLQNFFAQKKTNYITMQHKFLIK